MVAQILRSIGTVVALLRAWLCLSVQRLWPPRLCEKLVRLGPDDLGVVLTASRLVSRLVERTIVSIAAIQVLSWVVILHLNELVVTWMIFVARQGLLRCLIAIVVCIRSRKAVVVDINAEELALSIRVDHKLNGGNLLVCTIRLCHHGLTSWIEVFAIIELQIAQVWLWRHFLMANKLSNVLIKTAIRDSNLLASNFCTDFSWWWLSCDRTCCFRARASRLQSWLLRELKLLHVLLHSDRATVWLNWPWNTARWWAFGFQRVWGGDILTVAKLVILFFSDIWKLLARLCFRVIVYVRNRPLIRVSSLIDDRCLRIAKIWILVGTIPLIDVGLSFGRVIVCRTGRIQFLSHRWVLCWLSQRGWDSLQRLDSIDVCIDWRRKCSSDTSFFCIPLNLSIWRQDEISTREIYSRLIRSVCKDTLISVRTMAALIVAIVAAPVTSCLQAIVRRSLVGILWCKLAVLKVLGLRCVFIFDCISFTLSSWGHHRLVSLACSILSASTICAACLLAHCYLHLVKVCDRLGRWIAALCKLSWHCLWLCLMHFVSCWRWQYFALLLCAIIRQTYQLSCLWVLWLPTLAARSWLGELWQV